MSGEVGSGRNSPGSASASFPITRNGACEPSSGTLVREWRLELQAWLEPAATFGVQVRSHRFIVLLFGPLAIGLGLIAWRVGRAA